MAATQLAFSMERGAMSFDDGTGRWSVDFAKIPAAIEALAKQAATTQLTGDSAAGAALVARAVESTDGGQRLAPLLADPVARVKRTFQDAGTKSISMTCEVTGL